jgi:hypothetical protein
MEADDPCTTGCLDEAMHKAAPPVKMKQHEHKLVNLNTTIRCMRIQAMRMCCCSKAIAKQYNAFHNTTIQCMRIQHNTTIQGIPQHKNKTLAHSGHETVLLLLLLSITPPFL